MNENLPSSWRLSINACFWPWVIVTVFCPRLWVGVLAGDLIATLWDCEGWSDIMLCGDEDLGFLLRTGAIFIRCLPSWGKRRVGVERYGW